MRASFLYLSIDRSARVACLGFSTLVIDLLTDLCPPQVIDVWPAQIAKELPTFFLGQQYSSTVLAGISLVTVLGI